MSPTDPFQKVVSHILQHDLFSQWLGIEIIKAREGYCKAKMAIRKEMINGLGIVHGGIAFALADSTFAFACNNRIKLSVALDTSIGFIKPVHAGDVPVAESTEYIVENLQGFTRSLSPTRMGIS